MRSVTCPASANDVSTKTGEQVAIYVLDHNLEALLFRRSTEGAAAPRKV